MLAKAFLFLGIVSAAWFGYYTAIPPPVPQLGDQWWGQGEPRVVDESVRPFTIHVPDEVLRDLKERLARTRAPAAPLEGVGFGYGFNSKYLATVVDYWRDGYDWRRQEAALNALPHFRTNVAGLDLHFVHAKPAAGSTAGKKVVPVLLLHGWPGSFVEFVEMIPMLTAAEEEAEVVFEVVAPSLPGYGFSEAAVRPGLGPAEMGHLFDRLMQRLGYNDTYYVQGGDWGSLIGAAMATIYPHRVRGIHLNMASFSNLGANVGLALGSLWPTLLMPADQVHLVYPLADKMVYLLQETGYLHLQATKPDTVGVALSDSPAGLAAYILEKFAGWTDKSAAGRSDGGLAAARFGLDRLLTNVMVYWVTNSITTSMRLYSEAFSAKTLAYRLDEIPSSVPMAAAVFPNELFVQPEPLVRFKFRRMLSFRFMERGGHFAALEEPRLLADDLRRFVGQVRASSSQAE